MDSTDDYLCAGELRITKWVDEEGNTFVAFDHDDGMSQYEVLGMLRVTAAWYEASITSGWEDQ